MQAAGSAVEQLAQDYADQPVVFLEYDRADEALFPRERRWWTAYGGGSASLPLVMVDSGNRISNGYEEDFYTKHAAMVDASLARDAQAEIVASSQRSGDMFHFEVQVTNRTDETLGSGNGATVWAIVYEEFETSGSGRFTNRFVRTAVSTAISSDLAPDATETFTLVTSALGGVNWDNLRAILLVDYRPGSTSGAYDTLQAVSDSTTP